MTEPLDDLAARARDAAPARPEGAHLGAETLRRLRGDDERDEDAEAFRHLASCAACRARMVALDDPKEVAAAAAIVAKAQPSAANVIPLFRRPTVWIATLAVAAGLVLASATLLRGRDGRSFEVQQRTYAANMGSSDVDAAGLSAADLDVELSFKATDIVTATLLVIDGKGNRLATPRTFVRDGTGTFRVVIAPRTFSRHEGLAVGVVFAGNESAVRAATEATLGAKLTTEADLLALSKRHGVVFQRVAFAQ